MDELVQGSIWRKWDLHIHTPASFHWNDGKKFKEMNDNEVKESIKRIAAKINSTDIAVFATMDYFTFDGFIKIRKHCKENSEDTLKKTLLPGIELRIDAPVDYRLNIHAIFSEKVSDQELIDFKGNLLISGLNRALSDEAIIAAGRSLPADKAQNVIGNKDYKNDDAAAYELGIKTIKITRDSLFKAVENITKEKCLIVLPYDTSDGIDKLNWKDHPHDDCYFLKGSDIFETRNKDSIDLFLGRVTEKNKAYQESFLENIGGRPKPVVSGSDAHKVSDYGQYPSGKITWIKADPCFKGLKQLMVEPESRTFIGEVPEKVKMISSKTTKFIHKIDIKKKADSVLDDIWFDNSVILNPELVAIIGNKGSGKSALADIAGLLGNTKQEGAFSFLNEKKFCEKQRVKASKFFASLSWVSGDTASRSLSDLVESSSVETVKYIPQSYLEKLCNEISSEKSLFDKELKTVIFSHIDQDKRLGHATLDELINYKTEEASSEVKLIRETLNSVIDDILANELKLTAEYKQIVSNQLASKQSEFDAHLKGKPVEVLKPDNSAVADSPASKLVQELNEKQSEEIDLGKTIEKENKDLELLQKKKASIQKIISQADLIERQYQQSLSSIESSLVEIGIKVDQIFTFKLEKKPLIALIDTLEIEIKRIEFNLSSDNKESIINKRFLIQTRIKEISEQIDEPSKNYQKYLENVEIWNKVTESIRGDATKVGSIVSLGNLLAEIDLIPAKVVKLEEQRNDLVKNIFNKVVGLSNIYKEFYAPVQNFVSENPFGDDAFKMSFDVSIVESGFREKFFQQINRGRAGTFCGVEESEKRLSKIFDEYDFNKMEDVIKFVKEILSCLKNDYRDEKKPSVTIASQVKEAKVAELYKYIFSLDYLSPRYFLKLNDKALEQLSPGERGTLLLIFYLMVDRDDRPLIIDQPEENLDNQTIYKVLVPCIKKAKKNRQILLVTHNPNLAVVCDAEQIIVASINKANKNTVSYISGAIENENINKHILDVLEGTRPAFENRDLKYHF